MHDQYAIETDNWSLYSPAGSSGEIWSVTRTLTVSRFLRHAAAQQQYSSLIFHPAIRHAAQFKLNNREMPWIWLSSCYIEPLPGTSFLLSIFHRKLMSACSHLIRQCGAIYTNRIRAVCGWSVNIKLPLGSWFWLLSKGMNLNWCVLNTGQFST